MSEIVDLTKEGERCGDCGSNKAYLNCKVKGCAMLEYNLTEVNLYTKQNLPEGLEEISKSMNVKLDGDIIVVKTLSKYGSADESYEFFNIGNSIQEVMEYLRKIENKVVGYDPGFEAKNKYSMLECKNNYVTVRFRHDELTHKGSMRFHKGDLIICNEKDFILHSRMTKKPFGDISYKKDGGERKVT